MYSSKFILLFKTPPNPPIAGTDGRLFEKTLCYNCQSYGHYAGNCNEPNAKGTTLVYHGVVMAQTDKKNCSPISKEWILLDTQKTTDIICTAPDDACCTLSKYFSMEIWIIE